MEWKRLFDDEKCCSYKHINIPIGKTIPITDFIENENLVRLENECSEMFASCQESGKDEIHPNLIFHELDNAQCCSYKDMIIPFGETILDAEVKGSL